MWLKVPESSNGVEAAPKDKIHEFVVSERDGRHHAEIPFNLKVAPAVCLWNVIRLCGCQLCRCWACDTPLSH